MLAGTLLMLALAVAAYYLIVLRSGQGWLGLFPFTPEWRHLLWLLAGCAGLTAILGLFLKLVPLKYYYHPAVKLIAERYSMTGLIALYLANGLAEELLFRGAIQVWLGLIPAAVLFVLVHVSYYKQPLMLLYVLCMGIFLGLLYQWSGLLWICMLAHAFINWLLTWLIKTGRIDYAPPQQAE